MSVQILLATCNGAAYLPTQLDSILGQTYGDWLLLIRDDGSTDGTRAILADYRTKYPDKIVILPEDGKKLGACGSFAELMATADADYLLFCDQDDFWLPEKLACDLEKMAAMERQFGAALPLLVHSDLVVTDASLCIVQPSLWRFQHTQPEYSNCLNRLLVQNYATGCTIMINRAARDCALPVPAAAVMHDWWLTLVTAAFGQVGYLDKPLVFYRQHGLNDVGAQGFTVGDLCSRFRRRHEVRAVIRRLQCQAGAFLDVYRGRITPIQEEMLEVFANMEAFNGFLRRWYMLKYHFFYTGLLRNLGRLIIG